MKLLFFGSKNTYISCKNNYFNKKQNLIWPFCKIRVGGNSFATFVDEALFRGRSRIMEPKQQCDAECVDSLLMPPPSKKIRTCSQRMQQLNWNDLESTPFIPPPDRKVESCSRKLQSWQSEDSISINLVESQKNENETNISQSALNNVNSNDGDDDETDPNVAISKSSSSSSSSSSNSLEGCACFLHQCSQHQHMSSERQGDNCYAEINDGPGDLSCSSSHERIATTNVSSRGGPQNGYHNKNSAEGNAIIANRPFDEPSIDTRFSDIIGHGSAKLRIDELLLPLALPPSLAKSLLTGVRALPASILLYGPPGCGKTQLARAIAGEAQAAFLAVAPSDVLSKFVGESETAIRILFQNAWKRAQAMESGCAVLFFDEIDALGHSRGEAGDTGPAASAGLDSGCSRKVLAELLIQLTKFTKQQAMNGGGSSVRIDEAIMNGNDHNEKGNTIPAAANAKETQQGNSESGIEHTSTTFSLPSLDLPAQRTLHPHEQQHVPNNNSEARIIIVAATNRPEDCDSALLRRFAIRVRVGLPSKRDRQKIIGRLIGDIEHSITKSQLYWIALETEGWSGSDLESLAREACMAPIRECLRSAALLKNKMRKKQKCAKQKQQHRGQQGGDGSAQEKPNDTHKSHDDEEKLDTYEEARKSLLKGFQDLRPVTSDDFYDAVTFWLGNQETHNTQAGGGSFVQRSQQVHYDSTSSSDEESN